MAANRIWRDIKTLGQGQVLIKGSFRPKGTAAPAIVEGDAFTVARTSAGLYTITLADKYPSMESCEVSARVADATATIVQGGDYVAASKTLQIRTLQAGSTTARTKAVQHDILSARAASKTVRRHLMTAGALMNGSTPPTMDATGGGKAFDASAESAWLQFRVPDDWDGASDIKLVLVWHGEASHAIGNTETVKWVTTYHCVAPGASGLGEVVGVGAAGKTPLAVTTTYTQSGAGTACQEIRTEVTLDFDHADQPLAKGDTVYAMLNRYTAINGGDDTYGFDAVVTRLELAYQVGLAPLSIVASDALAGTTTEPYIARVNGATDPCFKLVWPAGCVDPVQLPPFAYPPDVNAAAALTVNLLALSGGETDTPVITVGAYEGIGDTDAGGNTAALGATIAEKSVSVAHGNVGEHPKNFNVLLTPGAHNTDAVELYAAWSEYTSTESPNALALADLADDVDNVVSFSLVMRNSTNTGA